MGNRFDVDPAKIPPCGVCNSKADICLECRTCLRCAIDDHDERCSTDGTGYQPETSTFTTDAGGSGDKPVMDGVWIAQYDCGDYYCEGDHMIADEYVYATEEAALAAIERDKANAPPRAGRIYQKPWRAEIKGDSQ